MGQGLLDKASKTARGPITRLALVRSMISRYRSFGPDKKAGTVGDLIRLLTLEKELLESDQPVKEIKVTWVTPSKTESGT